jgi:hypothetical protein
VPTRSSGERKTYLALIVSPTSPPSSSFPFTTAVMADTDDCAPTNVSDNLGLRIGSIFVIGVGAMAGALFPVLARRSRILKVPQAIFECVGSFTARRQ